MNLETKRELLKYKILNEQTRFDSVLYRILPDEYLSNVISKINGITFSHNISILEGEIYANQFLHLLNDFITTFRTYFF